MTKGDRATVRVHLGRIGADLLLPGQHDRRKSLVDLEGVDVVDRQAGAGEEVLGRVDGSGQHQHGIDADEAGVDDAGAGLQTEGSSLLLGHQQHGRRPVADLAGIAGGVHAVLPGDRLERGQLFEGALADPLVTHDGVRGAGRLALLVDIGCVDLYPLSVEATLGPRLRGQGLAAQSELIGIVTRNAPLVGDPLRAFEL